MSNPQQTIFNNEQQQEAAPQEQSQTPAQEVPKAFTIPVEAEGLVGEGKKYANVETALQSIPHAQNYIEEQKKQITELQEELAKRKGMEEVLSQMEAQKQPVETPSPGMDQEAVQQLMVQTLQQNEQQKIAEENVTKVVSQLQAKFGEKAEEIYNAKAAELGIGVDFLNSMAAKSSTAVLSYFNISENKQQQSMQSMGSNVNTEQLQQPPREKPKSVMFGATTQDMIEAYRLHDPNRN